MNRTNMLVVVIDGLRASALGAYGNTTFATPALDQFAADSFLLDFCFAPAADLRGNYRALWHAVHPVRPSGADDDARSLPQHFSDNSYTTTLITDDGELTSFTPAAHFDHCIQIAGSSSTKYGLRAADIAQTAMARLFAAACEQLESDAHRDDSGPGSGQSAAPRLVWVHSSGMYGAWDAPIELQESLLDEGDPPPLETTVPPDLALIDADDPDAAFRHSCDYAAQVIVLDACWQELMATLAARPAKEPWLVTLIGARGFPLGEHRRVGGVDHRLYVEQLHVPFLVRFPDRSGKLARCSALTSHVDLLPTLFGWLEPSTALSCDGMSILPLVSNISTAWRDAVLSVSSSSKSLRTPAWCIRQDYVATDLSQMSSDPSGAGELYVRPDDRWEANDVAKLCPDVVESLSGDSAQALRQLSANEPRSTRLCRK
jgi:arylsulfatase A-like enzyme